MQTVQLAPKSLLQEPFFNEANEVYSRAASYQFAVEAGINQDIYSTRFFHTAVWIMAPNIKLASRLSKSRGSLIARKCWEWKSHKAEIYSDSPNAITIPADEHGTIRTHRTIMSQSKPIITVPSLEIGQISASPEVLAKINWMSEHSDLVTGLTNVFTEQQSVMSGSSVALLTTTTLKQAVQRKRSEYWHPHDLMDFRLMTGELVRDLRNGVILPEDTRREVSWRCVSGSGKWRLITHMYETFIDEYGIAYQLSQNLGVDAIDVPTDLILV